MLIQNPLDMHLHLRDKEALKIVAPLSAAHFSAGVIMPNLIPPVCTLSALKTYKDEIKQACKDEPFTPLMTLFYQNYTPKFLASIKPHIFGIKLYPAGVTTNSKNGIQSFCLKEMAPTLNAMSELGIPLLVHGETHDFVMDREENFAPIYEDLAKNFKNLKICMEHITTKTLATLVQKYDNLHATITLHHLFITLDDVIGGSLNPHLFCKPVAKRPQDKDALRDLALNAHPRVMFGSDSAPHTKEAKLECGCAGVFSAPVCLSALAQLFTKHSSEAKLQAFISNNAQDIYKLEVEQKTFEVFEEAWTVSKQYGPFIPYLAGEKLAFSIKRIA